MSKCFPILWKVGRGGAEGVALPAPVAEVEDVSRADIDVDEADRNIERERAREQEEQPVSRSPLAYISHIDIWPLLLIRRLNVRKIELDRGLQVERHKIYK